MHPITSHSPGHLMGKKSIESQPELQETNHDSDYLTSSETAGVTERLIEALMQQKSQKQTVPQTADRLLRLYSRWREEDRDKYLREVSLWIIRVHQWFFKCYLFSGEKNKMVISPLQMSDLLLLALKLQDNDSTWMNARWIKIQSHQYLLNISSVTTYSDCIYFFLVRVCWKHMRSVFYQWFLIRTSSSNLITCWHDEFILHELRMLNKSNIMITALWISNHALHTSNGLFVFTKHSLSVFDNV